MEFVVLFFQDCSYQIGPHLAALSHKNPSLEIYSFSDKTLFPYGINLSPRDVNDKVAIITILIIEIDKNAANLSYDLLFQIN